MIIDNEDDVLIHYGILRKSGRYPWGSGGNVATRSRTFLEMVDDLKKQGLSEAQIADGLRIGTVDRNGVFRRSTTDLRALKAIAKNEVRASNVAQALRMKEHGVSTNEIANRMGEAEATVRSWLAHPIQETKQIIHNVVDMLRGEVDSQGLVDVGTGSEYYVPGGGISETRMKQAVAMLREEGYVVHNVQIDQLGTNQKTTIKVLAPKGTTYGQIAADPTKIGSLTKHSDDGGRSFLGLKPPENLSSKRVMINYAENGGADADGTIYLRRDAKDLSMGGKNYAQVRIAVDGTHYIKGMAMYRDDLPKGVDVVFNTNKSNTGNKLDALKPLKKLPLTDKDGKIVKDANGKVVDSDKVDIDNPFGAVIKPGGQKGVLNIVNEEGDWDKWSRSLASQVLSKQPIALAKAQLDAKYNQKKEEFDEIMSLTNPAVKKKLLDKFAEDADSSAVHLKAAALPGQRTQVILPMNSMKETEIYAPNYKNGDRVALVRFPHGGTFEIPELTVNNRNPTAKKIMGNAMDAVGINSKVAARLSGADFDGDTVLVIPNPLGKLKSTNPLEKLKGFDPQTAYPGYEGMPKLDDRGKQKLMGEVSNLITDMTIRGANTDELARAVRHSMVVIDAEKHNLNWRESARANGIDALKATYQGTHDNGRLKGASTLISRAQSDVRVPERKERKASEGGRVDPNTGKIVYKETGASYTVTTVSKRSGVATTKTVPKTTLSKALAEVEDAHKLSSGTAIESVYANHSNKLKALANQARKASIETPSQKRSPSAAKTYEKEVSTLKAKLEVALKNAPRERHAQIIGNAIVKQKVAAYPDMSKEDLKKIKGQALNEARLRVGAKKDRIDITPKEWEAIQAGAVSHNFLSSILNNTETETIKTLATPRVRTVMTNAKMARAKVMLAAGHTQADVAAALGVPVSTLHDALF